MMRLLFCAAILSLGIGAIAPAANAAGLTIIYDGRVKSIESPSIRSNDLWVTTADLLRVTGFVIKPQGVCRDELCFPLPKARKDEFVSKSGGLTWFNLSAFAKLIKQPVAYDAKNSVWAFGRRADLQNGPLTTLAAPDFTLPDMNGKMHSLSDFRGKKVLLVTWASW